MHRNSRANDRDATRATSSAPSSPPSPSSISASSSVDPAAIPRRRRASEHARSDARDVPRGVVRERRDAQHHAVPREPFLQRPPPAHLLLVRSLVLLLLLPRVGPPGSSHRVARARLGGELLVRRERSVRRHQRQRLRRYLLVGEEFQRGERLAHRDGCLFRRPRGDDGSEPAARAVGKLLERRPRRRLRPRPVPTDTPARPRSPGPRTPPRTPSRSGPARRRTRASPRRGASRSAAARGASRGRPRQKTRP